MTSATKPVGLILEFLQQITLGQATRTADIAPGVVVAFNDDFPVSHVQNVVTVTAGATANSVLVGLDLLEQEGRHPHVNFWLDDGASLADSLDRGLDERGLRRENNELLLYAPGPSPSQQATAPSTSRPTTQVESVPGSALDPVVRDGWRHDLPTASDDAISQLVDRRTAYESAVDTSYVAVRIDGIPVSRATLYRSAIGAHRIGQVEDVNTIEEHRGRGYAGACVTRGIEILQDADCDLIFLESDADDWPRQLYFRLGFTHLAPLPVFTGRG